MSDADARSSRHQVRIDDPDGPIIVTWSAARIGPSWANAERVFAESAVRHVALTPGVAVGATRCSYRSGSPAV